MALIKCKECGQMISDNVTECPNCGAPMERKMFCEECGEEISPGMDECPNCGAPLEVKTKGKGQICEECGQFVPDDVTECPNCGAPVERKMFCEECGEEISAGMDECLNCGCPITKKKIGKTLKALKEANGEKLKKRIFITIGLSGILVVACVLGLYVKHTTTQEQLLKAQIAAQTEQLRLQKEETGKEKERADEAEGRLREAEAERRRREGVEIVITLHAEMNNYKMTSWSGSYGANCTTDNWVQSKLIEVPKGKVWIFKSYKKTQGYVPAICEDWQLGYRYRGKDLNNQEIFKRMGGDVFYIQWLPDFRAASGSADAEVRFVEKDEADY